MTLSKFNQIQKEIEQTCSFNNQNIQTLHNGKTLSYIKKNSELVDYINYKTSFLQPYENLSLFKRYKLIINNILKYENCLNPSCENTTETIEKKICSNKSCKQWYKKYIHQVQKENREKTTLERYGTKNVFEQEKYQVKARETIQAKYGVENISQDKNNRNKAKQSMIKNNGGVGFASSIVRDKAKKSMVERYGVGNPSQSSIITERKKQVNLDKYGVEYYFQTEDFQYKRTDALISRFGNDWQKILTAKAQSTMVERYGCENPLHYDSFLLKQQKSTQEKYGVSNVSKLPEIRLKAQKTMVERYGVSHILQNAFYAEKALASSFKYKEINGRKLQGYEDKTYLKLLENFDDSDILDKRTDMPEIWYSDIEGKKHRYYPDFYIPKANLVIETKSEYTMYKDLLTTITNMKKESTTIDLGFKFEFDIYK